MNEKFEDVAIPNVHPQQRCEAQPLRSKKIRRMRSETKLHKNGKLREGSVAQRGLDLSFDIDLAEGRDLRSFEERARLPGEEAQPVLAALEEVLPVVVVDELRCIGVRLERQLFGDESDLDIGLVPKWS